MSRYSGRDNATRILEAADYWRTRAIDADGAVFVDEPLWIVANLEAIDRHYVQQLDFSDRKFLDKLEGQLKAVPAAAKQLAAEMLWIMLLCPNSITVPHKIQTIETVWGWSGETLVLANLRWMQADVLAGVGSAGPGFNQYQWRELVFFVRTMLQLKQLSKEERSRVLATGWNLAEWLEQIPECNVRQFRHMLLFLLYPDEFERIFSGNDRKAIVLALGGSSAAQVNRLTAREIDVQLSAIRKDLEKRFATKELDFYEEPVKNLWRTPKEAMTAFTATHVRDALASIDSNGVPADAASTGYDFIYGGKRYPPKYVVALATHNATGTPLDRSQFSGGEDSKAFSVLRDLGFYVERKDFVQELLRQFLGQAAAETDLVTRQYPGFYCGLTVKVSFGQGTFASIPWIAFLSPGQSVSKGIYPVFLYYKAFKTLVLAYGISETESPAITWVLPDGTQTLEVYFREHQGVKPQRYGSSYLHAAYEVNGDLDFDLISRDLDALIARYQSQFVAIGKDSDEQPATWLFQANPKLYDVDRALEELPEVTWLVKQHADKIRIGDRAYVWRSGQDAGIVGELLVIEGPSLLPQPEFDAPYTVSGQKFAGEQLRVHCKVVRHLSQIISRETVLATPGLESLSILRAPQGTNFLVTSAEASLLEKLSGQTAAPLTRVNPRYTAEQLCEESGFALGRVQHLVRQLRRKKHLVLQGPPGTGKTYFAERLSRVLISDTRGVQDIVQFHPSYAYEDFVQGIRPEVIKGQMAFHMVPGRFVEFCTRAVALPKSEPCVLVIDELNRANLSRVFGELMYLLEYRDREIPLSGGGRRFRVPENVFVIGTMNTADRSIALVDHALRRRFTFAFLGPEYEALEKHVLAHGLPGMSLSATLRNINRAIADRNFELGISFFMNYGAGLREQLPAIWEGEIEPYLEEFFFDRLDKVDPFRWRELAKTTLSDWVQQA
jgi:hypothetical protein